MSGHLQPDEAASALAGIREQQEQVIHAVLVPSWYWWAVAALMVVIGGATDMRRPAVLAVIIPVAAVIIGALTLGMIFGTYRRAQVRSRQLLGDRGALLIVAFVWLVVGLTLGTGFGLRAAGSPVPATIATAIGGGLLAAGGPVLMRRLRAIMLGNRAGSRR
jgi:hypothetical protein